MLIKVTLCALERVRKMKILSLILLPSIKVMKRKYLGLLLTTSSLLKVTFKILCKKAAQKIGALSRLLNHLSDSQKRLIFNSIIKLQFNKCPLIWMFCFRTSNNMINKIYERVLRLILNDHTIDFDILLQNNNDTQRRI